MKQNSLNVKEKKLSKIAFSHVGCEKNLVDTEHMQGLLDKEGYEVDSNINDANVVVVNTCSFIETAREESIRKILEYTCLLYTSPSPRDPKTSRMPSSA